MIDQILGRPSATVRRSEVFLVLFFWLWRLYKGDGSAISPLARHRRRNVTSRYNMNAGSSMVVPRNAAWWRRIWQALFARGPGARWTTAVNQRLKYFTPYQLIIGTFTVLYAFRHLDDLLGLSAPEPMTGMYSRSFYRATYVNTALDAGFASAMAIRPKWLKDLASCLFTVYYLIFSRQADEVLRRWRGFCSVEMLRTTWEKTNNPYLRFFTASHRAKLPYVRHVTIARPSTSSRANLPPVNAMFFFDGTASELEKATELIMDFPGGGFVAMGPECHEERLRIWAKRTGKPVLSVNYGKAPEYPYPWAIEEGIDAYRTITDSKGSVLGIKSGKLRVVLTGDSAGGNICTTIMNRILEHPKHIDRPVAMILAYPALDFNYTSWMSPTNLKVLQTEQSETHIPGLLHGKDHLAHKAPLSVVDDTGRKRRSSSKTRKKSWADSITGKFGISMSRGDVSAGRGSKSTPTSPVVRTSRLPRAHSKRGSGWFASHGELSDDSADASESDLSDTDDDRNRGEADKSLAERVKTPGVLADERFAGGILEHVDEDDNEEAPRRRKATTIGTRLTMTSRVGYFQDRIITPSMMRAMAILYIGPNQSPDFETDYYISPILSPAKNLAHFPPVYLICGERDPFVDDTVIFAGKLREAKRARRAEAERAQPANRGRHGEALRMSNDPNDHILHETDEDWVQMRIIEGWGHGFMQMNALMREIDPVLIEMADWIDESFERQTLLEKERAALVVQSPTDPIPSPLRSRHVKPAREYQPNPTNKALGVPDLGLGFDFDGGGDDDGMISFTTKSRRRTPPSSQFIPVPRRASRETLTRNNSAPRFDADDSGSSGEIIETPPSDAFSLLPKQPAPKGAGTFAFFGPRQTVPPARPQPKSAATSLYATATTSRRGSPQPPASIPPNTPQAHNPLLAAVSATTRAASPALAAAGLVPQSVQNLSQAELFRRRRQEMMVAGMDGSAPGSDHE